MKINVALACWATAAQAANIVMSNDDGWAEINVRYRLKGDESKVVQTASKYVREILRRSDES